MAERPFRKPKIRLHLPADEDRCGTGALCAEAQADGVPCGELGRECETCDKAVRGSFKRGLAGRPADRSTASKAGAAGTATAKPAKPSRTRTPATRHR